VRRAGLKKEGKKMAENELKIMKIDLARSHALIVREREREGGREENCYWKVKVEWQ
jgi:hypothetical protein